LVPGARPPDSGIDVRVRGGEERRATQSAVVQHGNGKPDRRRTAIGGGGTGDGSVVVDAIAIDIRGSVDSAKLFLPAGLRRPRPLQVAPAK
jgi:hypothetical protein